MLIMIILGLVFWLVLMLMMGLAFRLLVGVGVSYSLVFVWLVSVLVCVIVLVFWLLLVLVTGAFDSFFLSMMVMGLVVCLFVVAGVGDRVGVGCWCCCWWRLLFCVYFLLVDVGVDALFICC